MNAAELKALQTPIKAKYREQPSTALVTMSASGRLDPNGIVCRIDARGHTIEAGLHAAAGGDGSAACSVDMLLESLVACAGVTLRAVATALEIPLKGGTVMAEGVVDFRGTLGVDRETPIGVQEIQLTFDLDAEATEEQLQKLLQLTERYCVIFQTLRTPPKISAEVRRLV